MIFLDDQEREQLKARHQNRLERDGRVRDRIKAVLLYDKKWSISTIAEALPLSDDAIRNHIMMDLFQSYPLISRKNWWLIYASIPISYVKDIIAYVQSYAGITYTIPGMNHTGSDAMDFPIRSPRLSLAKPIEKNNKNGSMHITN